jgi:hypothetical protein
MRMPEDRQSEELDIEMVIGNIPYDSVAISFYSEYRQMANKPIELPRGLTPQQALELLSNGSCGD